MIRPLADSPTTRRRNRMARRPQAETLEGRLLLTAGDLDLSFDNDGYVLTNSEGSIVGDVAYAVAIQPDGKVLAAGSRWSGGVFEVVRRLQDGSPDPEFGSGGRAMPLSDGYAFDMAIQIAPETGLPDGRIVLAGYLTT